MPKLATDQRAGKELANAIGSRESSVGAIDLSVVCPFYNEEAILKHAVETLLGKLAEMRVSWELIVVNDGSLDGSKGVVESLLGENDRLRLVSYPTNRGRGHALRAGIAHARGDVIVTTEIDLSWGEDIVERLYREMQEHPDADIVVASPHLKGGRYKNVPRKRVLVSQFGNWVIRACMTNAATMNTGMTRAYRRAAIKSLPLEEDGKEFHLEVILKATAFKYRLREIPSILEWKSHKHEGKTVKRKSSSKIKRLIVSHSLFSIFANPIRYVWGLSIATALTSVGFLVWSVYRLLTEQVAAFALITGLSLMMMAMIFFTFGVIAQQGNMIQRELWTIKRSLLEMSKHEDF